MSAPVIVKKIVLWRTEVSNQPGKLAATLKPLAQAGADLKVVMGYRHAGGKRSAIEVYPVSGRKQIAAAEASGLSASSIPALLIEGEDRPGMGFAISEAVAGAGINLAFFVAQVFGSRYSAVAGFEKEDDAKRAVAVIKKAAAAQ
jgi:hypothetical protein